MKVSESARKWLDECAKGKSERDVALLRTAVDVLYENTLQGEDMPWGNSPATSPWSGATAGLWNWDSVFHAMTEARFDIPLGKSCIDSFVKFQCEDGMLPDCIHVDGRVLTHSSKPPVFPWGVLKVYEADGDEEFLKRNYGALVKNEAFWRQKRYDGKLFFYSASYDVEKDNCLYARWESGWDDSPRWDNPPILDLWPVDLNCFMVLFYRSMKEIARILGEPHEEWAEREADISRKVEELLFDEAQNTYVDRNRLTGEFSRVLSPAGFMPLFVGIASAEHARAMEAQASDPKKFFPGMPTVAYDDPAFSTQYWRGQTWLNVAFFAVKGLWDYGYRETAGQIREFLLDMVYDNLSRGICENYDTVKRVGKFTARFSWSAAFVIEFVLEMRE